MSLARSGCHNGVFSVPAGNFRRGPFGTEKKNANPIFAPLLFIVISPHNTPPMTEQLSTLIKDLKGNSIPFSQVLAFIETYYQYQPAAFKNGDVYNEATQNQGSAKVFSFAHLNNLSNEDTLYLFAEHYQSVLANPDAVDHQNIRQFMIHGWEGISFESPAVVL